MRETKAKGIAIGTGLLILGAVSLFAIVQQDGSAASAVAAGSMGGGDGAPPGAPSAVADAGVPEGAAQDSILMAGRAAYDDANCAACHSIAGEGSPRVPLDGVGGRLSADVLRLWIVDPQAVQPGVRKPAFDYLPDEDVDALVAYLQSLTD